ncbi:NADP-reducing hydrogenase subunit HndC [bacterium BMS3Abin14]|nr:NADP-reducing hydrogenase subunit HndC [bacterium BMS3Abin14]
MKILTRNIDRPNPAHIDSYLVNEGYVALPRALNEMGPEDVLEEVKLSRLRGRGGAGFPAGMKWDFASRDRRSPKFIICNADEGEPGTFKDRVLIENDPHAILEGMALAAYAVGAEYGFIYIRGEYPFGARVLERAIKEAEERSFLGENILNSGFNFTITVHRGAGAYVCGEETALIESLEGKRGQSRIRPPFPVNVGYSDLPTVVNNVETLASIPQILLRGGDWYAGIGTPECPGTKLFSVSGHVVNPGVYELPMGVTLRELVFEHAGGMRDNRSFKAAFPGGASSACLDESQLDVKLDFNALAAAGSMLGSGAVMVLDDTADMVKVTHVLIKFFEHESCGKCTPCREGLFWVRRIFDRILEGRGAMADLDLLSDICESIRTTSFCGLGEASVSCVTSTMEKFRDEYLGYLKGEEPDGGTLEESA